MSKLLVDYERAVIALEAQPKAHYPEYDTRSQELAVRAGAAALSLREALWTSESARRTGRDLATRAEQVKARAEARTRR